MSKEETILIADNAEMDRAILRSLFEKEYNLLEAENGAQALVLLRQYKDSISVALLDLMMPEKDGYEVLETMHTEGLIYQVPVVVITAESSIDSKVRVFSLGASDIITKPFEVNVITSRVLNIIELGRYRHRLEALVKEQSARARESNAAVIDMLSSVIEHRDLESGQHIRRIRMFTRILLEEVARNYQEYDLDEQKIQMITDASSMHDIGKIAIPDSILMKPGKLTEEEYELMKTHTVKGCEILSGLDRLQDMEYLQYAYHICRYHHERWDGGGYPEGLKGDSIPICAQVVGIADCYDALMAERIYKKSIPQNQVFSMILNGECGVFSPRLLECFKNVREPFEQLAKEYADGRDEDSYGGQLLEGRPSTWDMTDNTLEQSRLKYLALLRYLDCTVMEVDFHTGIYQLAYLSSRDFAALKQGGTFEGSIGAFAKEAVHPEDREAVLRLPKESIQELFDEGLTRREYRCRVFDSEKDTYTWCGVTVLRMNLENPRLYKVLILWKKEKEGGGPSVAEDEGKEASQAEDEGRAAYQAAEEGGKALKAIPQAAMLELLLGGVQKLRCDRYHTLLQVSRQLVSLLGYSKEELRTDFQNRYMELVYPGDRRKLFTQFTEQYNSGKVIELEYRLVRKDGRSIWVNERCMVAEEGPEEVLYSILLDITASKQAQEELRLSLERYHIISNQTNDIIFEWDIRRDEVLYATNWERQFGYTPITKRAREEIEKASHIYPEDVPQFLDLMDSLASGVPYKEVEFRIADAKGKYRWRRIRATAQYDVDGKPFKAVGIMLDIDAEKRTSVKLEEKAAQDALTGLYNKAAAKEKVERYLESALIGDVSALMAVDVDDFKKINDRYGHMYGDEVLIKVASKLVDLFRGNDVVARIGGDEFLIFMPNVRHEAIAEHRAKETIFNLKDLLSAHCGKGGSISVGLAFSYGMGMDYQTLFNQADRALYRAKADGKNCFMRYRRDMEGGPIGFGDCADCAATVRPEGGEQ